MDGVDMFLTGGSDHRALRQHVQRRNSYQMTKINHALAEVV